MILGRDNRPVARNPFDRKSRPTPVGAVLDQCRTAFWSVALISAVVNILMFTSPLYMLQVYDRVLASRSIPTLVAITLLMMFAYLAQGLLDAIRSRIVVRIAAILDEQLAGPVHDAVTQLGLVARSDGQALTPLRDLDQIRAFLSSQGPIAVCDMPWMPIFLIICFLLHPLVGVTALVGAIILTALAVMTELSSRKPMLAMLGEQGRRGALAEGARRNSETALALGMMPSLRARFVETNERYVGSLQAATDVTNGYGAATKTLRMAIQSIILGVGAYLVIRGEMTAGGMIAASILMGRALAPVEQVIGSWRAFIGARESVKRLGETLLNFSRTEELTALPRPHMSLAVQDLATGSIGSPRPILQQVNFQLSAGEILGVIGPSGSGKTSLARALVGVWPLLRGTVRLDGAETRHWSREDLGRLVGYVPQDIALFDGTVAENIARFQRPADDEAIIAAARAAGAHELILAMPQGYDTPIGDGGAMLSGGQRQRIALARALFGNPFLLILDEPNANLDGDGELAMMKSLRALKDTGRIILLITHRPQIIQICDKVLLLANGTQQAFGPRDEVLRRLMPNAAPVTPLKVVGETGSTGAANS
jgi:ATP-binding cassette subfamily C protein